MRISLRWKIAGGFGLMLALIALLGWVTLSLFSSLRDIQRRVFDEAIPGLVAVDEIVLSYTAQSDAVRGALIASGSQRRLLAQYESEVTAAEFHQRRAQPLFTGSERNLLDRLVAAGDEFHRLVDRTIVPLALKGNRSQAFRVLDGEGARLITQISIQGELLRTTQEDRIREMRAEVSADTRTTLFILLIVLFGALLMGLFLAIALPRRLVRNFDQLVQAARAAGRGDLDHKLDVRSHDEAGELAARFTDMQAGLKRLQQLALQDRELEIAATVQRNLLSRSIPPTSGARVYPLQRQANLVGGDWYDVEISGEALNIAVGDASGKGIAAALMATIALSFLRAERGLGRALKRVVQRTNEALLQSSDPGSFTTLIYATLDVKSGDLRWLNMGHPAPFLLRADGNETRGFFLEGPRNRALGWFEDPGLAEAVARLRPGDCLVLFTDGFLEAKSSQGEVFGEHRFADTLVRLGHLDPAALGEELVGEVERFAAGKLDDDLTMLVVEFQGAEQELPQEHTGEQAWHSRR